MVAVDFQDKREVQVIHHQHRLAKAATAVLEQVILATGLVVVAAAHRRQELTGQIHLYRGVMAVMEHHYLYQE